MADAFAGNDRFEVLRLLGHGGMGCVYEVYDRARQARVALKLLSRFSPTQLFLFKQEFRSLAATVHPNLVGLHELLCEGDQWFFTMDLVEGTDFLSYVRGDSGLPPDVDPLDKTVSATPSTRPDETGADLSQSASALSPCLPAEIGPPLHTLGPEAEARLRGAATGLAIGIAALHRAGRIHRDLKPSNVKVTPEGRAVILDFGLVASPEEAAIEAREFITGTIPYMSPEQATGEKLTPASDWYSFGVMLYEALTGQLPCSGTVSEVLAAKRKLPPFPPAALPQGPRSALHALCLALLAPRPEDRPDAPHVLDRLEAGGPGAGETTISEVVEQGPLVGRVREMQALLDALAGLRRGQAGVAWVEGRSGMGKSALLSAFLEDARKRDAVVLAGRCCERESVPYKAVDAVVDGLAAYLAALPPREVERLQPRHLRALEQLFPVMGQVGGTARAALRAEEGLPDPREVRRRAFSALRELMCRLGDAVALVVAIDDLQWGDVDSAVLLGELVRPPDAPALLLVLAHRSEALAASPALPLLNGLVGQHVGPDQVRRVVVGPLPQDEAEQLARRHCPANDPGARARAAHIASESQGIPFFIEELARATAHSGLDPAMPLLSLDEYTRRRVAGLPAGARSVLELLAVAGQPLPCGLAWNAAGLPAVDLAALKLLQGARLIRTEGTGREDPAECYHDRIRESVSTALSPDARQACHLALAAAWEAWPCPDREAIAHHLKEGGERVKAAHAARLAAHKAASGLAFDKAAGLFRSALELGDWSPAERRSILEALAPVLAAAGRGKQAADAYLEIARQGDGEEEWRLQAKAAEQLLSSGHTDEGKVVLDRALARFGLRLPRTPTAALAALLVQMARNALRGLRFTPRLEQDIPGPVLDRIDVCRSAAITMGLADPVRSSVFQARALSLALRAGEPCRVARQLAVEGGYAAAFGGRGYARSSALLARARELAEQTADPRAMATYHACHAIALFQQGRWPECMEQAAQGERVCLDAGLHAQWELQTCRLYRAGTLGWIGAFREYCARTSEMLADADERNDLQTANHVRGGSMIPLQLLRDDPAAAAADLDRCSAWLPAHEFSLLHAYVLRSRCCVALYRGDAEAALAAARELSARVRRSMVGRVALARIYALETLGNAAAAAAGRVLSPQAAAAKLAGCVRGLRRMGLAWTDAQARLVEAGRLRLLGQTVEAAAAYDEAARGFDQLQMRQYAAACRFRIGPLVLGPDRNAQRQAALAAMEEQGVAAPARLLAALAA